MPPAHPLCSPTPDIDCCRESWRSHLADLALKLQVSSHKCRFGRLCAVVPVIWDQRCVAVCRLVCPQSMGEEAFEHHVELLAVLIENFVARHGAGLSADVLFTAKTTAQTPPSAGPTAARQGGPPLHAKVKSAAEYIDEHLRDIDLNAAQIARHLGINATYLAHLFVDQTGMRMNRYVAVQRVETAKRLLAVTDWQIKRIARESGYANPDWFGHVFHALTGMTPSDYRQKIRDSGPASTSE